jgi:hypothetical protein
MDVTPAQTHDFEARFEVAEREAQLVAQCVRRCLAESDDVVPNLGGSGHSAAPDVAKSLAKVFAAGTV